MFVFFARFDGVSRPAGPLLGAIAGQHEAANHPGAAGTQGPAVGVVQTLGRGAGAVCGVVFSYFYKIRPACEYLNIWFQGGLLLLRTNPSLSIPLTAVVTKPPKKKHFSEKLACSEGRGREATKAAAAEDDVRCISICMCVYREEGKHQIQLAILVCDSEDSWAACLVYVVRFSSPKTRNRRRVGCNTQTSSQHVVKYLVATVTDRRLSKTRCEKRAMSIECAQNSKILLFLF